jgi:cyclopropane fatty-acyl-phospholipid synthase-like methyltransferase
MTDMNEEDIRPKAIFDIYLEKAKNDALNFFEEHEFEISSCVSCGSIGEESFQKFGFSYVHCKDCSTIYVSPRPSLEALSRFYDKGESVKYWSTDFYKKTQEARREKLWLPKVKKIKDLFANENYDWVCDIGGGYGIFAEEYRAATNKKIVIIEPSSALANVCTAKGFEVIEEVFESVKASQLPDGRGLFVSFELFEHLHNPKFFLESFSNLAKNGDFLLFTTLSSNGLDLAELREKSNSIFPPHHLNFFNPKSIRILAERIGLEVVSVTTPGLLDVDILQKHIGDMKEGFLKEFLLSADNSVKKEFQELISRNGFSSHMWTILKKN